ncbi:hypothetical protein D0863_04836 [Hortaea werneckii]|uniref:Uncharacterized protein n=1 Tax=Hortaea werneckii TaxID=91943 RepID=A0A3M7E5T5_HORWE|nr:hypothetical protein D0863_04836 [Hortaea werneckii]
MQRSQLVQLRYEAASGDSELDPYSKVPAASARHLLLYWRSTYRACGTDFNRLCEGHIADAGGFGQYPAGLGVSSTYDYATIYWEDAAERSLKHMAVGATHKVEKDRRAAIKQEKQRLVQEIDEYEMRMAMALVNPIAKLDEQFPGDLSPEVLALHEDGLDSYIAEIEGRLDDRTDGDANLEGAVDFYKTEQLQKPMGRWLEAMGDD